jgi:hypothetical protein
MKEHDIDVLGAYPPPKSEADEFSIIRRLSREYGELIIAQIKLAREIGPIVTAEVPPLKPLPLWQRLACWLRK